MISNTLIDEKIFHNNWKWFLLWGIALIILGCAALSVMVFTTLLSVIFLGALLLAAGMIILIDTFSFWRVRMSGFLMHFLMGILYIFVGLMLIKDPLAGSVTLTFLLGFFYLILGFVRIFYSLSFRSPQWQWSLFNAFISLLIGMMILMSWPASSLVIIGLFVGIDLVFGGMVYVFKAMTGRRFLRNG